MKTMRPPSGNAGAAARVAAIQLCGVERRIVDQLVLGDHRRIVDEDVQPAEVFHDGVDQRPARTGCLGINGAVAGKDESEPVRQALVDSRALGNTQRRERVERAQAEGDLPTSARPDALAAHAMALRHGMAIQARAGFARAVLDAVVEQALSTWPAAGAAPRPPHRAPGFAARADKPMKIFSMVVLAALALIAFAKEWAALTGSFAAIGLAVVLFNAASLGLGYYVPRIAGLDQPNAVAIGYEIGIHNSTLAIFVAVSVLGDFQLMVPAAIYSVSMYVLATAFGLLVLRRQGRASTAAAAPSP